MTNADNVRIIVETAEDTGVTLAPKHLIPLFADRLAEKQADVDSNDIVVNGRHLDAFIVNKPA